MEYFITKCIKGVGVNLECPACNGSAIKYGKSKSGNQRYQCKSCSKTFLYEYKNKGCRLDINAPLIALLKEGCGIRSISRLLKISVTTVMKRICMIAKKIGKPVISFGKEYEVDEMCTYVKRKTRKRWIV